MVLIFTTYLFVLAMLLVVMVMNRLSRVDGDRFLATSDFWEVSFIGICLTVLCYLIMTSEEIGIGSNLTFN
jgi:hypothetical protein